jgi:hypothetical protein
VIIAIWKKLKRVVDYRGVIFLPEKFNFDIWISKVAMECVF